MRLDSQVDDDGWRVRLVARGELDSQTSESLLAAVTELVTRPLLDRVVLDLSGLTFIDAAGIRCLLRCEEAASRNGVRLDPCLASPAVVRIVEIVGLGRHFGFESAGSESGTGAHDGDEIDDLVTWSLRARRQAHDIRVRAQHALRQSLLPRDVSSTRPTR